MGEWISVRDKLPKDTEEILMTYNDFVMEGFFSNGKFYYPYTFEGSLEEQEGITHWMELPKPPNGESNAS